LRRSEIPGIETNIPYIIQAKRYSPDKTLNPRYIRELRGAMKSGERGILITTAKISRKSIEEEALKDISRIILAIDGEQLIRICRDQGIGIHKKYSIDINFLNNLATEDNESKEEDIISTKLVSENDIRARILRIPKDVKAKLGKANKISIYFSDDSKNVLNIDKSGTFAAGVTDVFRKFGLFGTSGALSPKLSEWSPYKEGFLVKFKEIAEKTLPDISAILKDHFGKDYVRIDRSAIFASAEDKILCRFSRLYTRDTNYYWYAILPKDVQTIKRQNIVNLVFICGLKYIVVIQSKDLIDVLPELNTSNHADDTIKHYHILFKEMGNKIVWILKGGKPKEVQSFVIQTKQDA
jgi:hypothetical protein